MLSSAERIKSAYLGLAIAAFLVAVRFAADTEEEPKESRVYENAPRRIATDEAYRVYDACLGPERNVDPDVRRLTYALAAVESFARPAWQRKLEGVFAKAYLSVSGRLPDLSLGLAQLRVSTARLLLLDRPPMTEWDVLAQLLDDCSNLHLAFAYVRRLADRPACEARTDPALDAVKSLPRRGDQDTPSDEALAQARRRFRLEMKELWLPSEKGSGCSTEIIRDYNGQSATGPLGGRTWPGFYVAFVRGAWLAQRPHVRLSK